MPGASPPSRGRGERLAVSAARTVLIVEDEAFIALDLMVRLRASGFRVAGVLARGEDAADRVLRERPDIVLMDVHLAGEISGIEAVRRIRASSSVPVIFMSGYAQDAAIFENAAFARPCLKLNKPIEFVDLLEAIETAMAG